MSSQATKSHQFLVKHLWNFWTFLAEQHDKSTEKIDTEMMGRVGWRQ